MPTDKVFSSEQIKQGFAEFKEQADQLYATKDELDDKQDTIEFNTAYNPSTNKAATMDDINSAITGVYKVKGGAAVSTLNGLTPTESMNGDVYNITTGGTLTNYSGSITVAAGDNVVLVWNSGSWYWDKLASTVDLSGYAQSNTSISSSSKGVALGGTIGNPTIVVTGGSVADGNTSVVDGGTVYAAFSSKQNTLTTSSVNDGTINKVIGFDNQGNLVKGEAGGGGGTQLYKHMVGIDGEDEMGTLLVDTVLLIFITSSSTPITTTQLVINNSEKLIYGAYDGSIIFEIGEGGGTINLTVSDAPLLTITPTDIIDTVTPL